MVPLCNASVLEKCINIIKSYKMQIKKAPMVSVSLQGESHKVHMSPAHYLTWRTFHTLTKLGNTYNIHATRFLFHRNYLQQKLNIFWRCYHSTC